MRIPEGLQILLDGDIILYECSHAAEAGWKAKTNTDNSPPWHYVQKVLEDRLASIQFNCRTDKPPIIYYTEGVTFRYDLAKKRPYKDQRKKDKPFHFENMKVYLRDILDARVVTNIEADDQLAIDHTASGGTTVIASRDKDMRQVGGWSHSWELGLQPSWTGLVDKVGSLTLKSPTKLTGTGYAWFAAQCLIGDPVDTVPGLPGCGPVKAYSLLSPILESHQKALQGPPEAVEGAVATTLAKLEDAVVESYRGFYEPPIWERELTEQAQLVWLVRRLNPDSSPELWRNGLYE